jgi:methionine synthase / methylenetetrahydrofolate reductase (NADH)
MDFLDELEHRIIPGDGAMGTLLMERGVPLERCFEELCVSAPETVRRIHEEYIGAQARLIETNSFGANAVRLARHGLEHRVSEINWSAAQLARDCARGKSVHVAGSVGPLLISAEQAGERGIDRRAVFNEQIGALLDGGAQLIFLETFLDLEELLLALEVKQSLHHCPAICSLACNEEGRLGDGTPLTEAFARLRAQDAEVVGVNCVNGPEAMVRLFGQISVDGHLSAFPNAGRPQFLEGRFLYSTTPECFARSAVQLAGHGARLIGGCCGIAPKHIAAMAEALKEFVPENNRP